MPPRLSSDHDAESGDSLLPRAALLSLTVIVPGIPAAVPLAAPSPAVAVDSGASAKPADAPVMSAAVASAAPIAARRIHFVAICPTPCCRPHADRLGRR